LSLAFCLAAPTSSFALDTEVELQGSVTSQITGLSFGPAGTYSKPGFPLLLPDTGFVGNTLTHDGGSFTFSSDDFTTGFTYADWIYDFDAGLVNIDDVLGVGGVTSSPFSLSNVDLVAGSADLLFTQDGADDWNTLAGGTPFSSGDIFATTTFVPEPNTALLLGGGLLRVAVRGRRRRA